MLLAQTLLSFFIEGEGPVRFGFPLPAEVLARGLSLSDRDAKLQWRPLQEQPDPVTERVWVELAVAGARGRVRLRARGVGPVDGDEGPVLRVEREKSSQPGRMERLTRWRWCTGEVDQREVSVFLQIGHAAGERFEAGESWTRDSADLAGRFTRVRIAPKEWVRAGVLPPLGPRAKRYREHLVDAAEQLEEMPGVRGKGDYQRSRGVITNLEFDTTLGFARLGLAMENGPLLSRALAAARHLADRDIHPSGLPFCHGQGHRAASPEPGHAWLTGLLLVGCVTADRDLIRVAGGIAHGLARRPPQGEGEEERARDYGWPLLELEAWLRFRDDDACRRAADRFAASILSRWDARNRVLRFGEGERQRRTYEERAWLTGGILLPALRAYAMRVPGSGVRETIAHLERRLVTLVTQGKAGIPVRYWITAGDVRGQVRLRGVPEVFMTLEGVADRDLAKCLRRSMVSKALAGVPRFPDEDLPTAFSIAARCSWVLR